MGEELFDMVADSVFFIKDREGRYVTVNQTLVDRCGRKSKDELIGRTAREVFPAPLGTSFTEQDFEVIREGRPISGQLEMHLYPNGSRGWCITWKQPVINGEGEVIGVSGISRDIRFAKETTTDLNAVAVVLEYIDKHIDEPLRLSDLAEMAGLSTYQLDQRIKSLFEVSAGQYVTRKRIEKACHLLEKTKETIGIIALDCGYGDQSAFSRQFRQSVGITPGAFRDSKTKT